MNKPVTEEYAIMRIKKALLTDDYEEADKWKLCLQGICDMRIRSKEREREIKQENFRQKLIEMYRYPIKT